MDKSTRKGKVKKQEIIEAFLRLMETTPFEEISVTDICAAAGISIGGFYHYFNRKNDILILAFQLNEEHLVNKIVPLFSKNEPVENLKTFAHHWAIHIYKQGIKIAKPICTLAPSDYDHKGHINKTKQILFELFRTGQAMGQIPEIFGAERMADLFLIALRGVFIDWARRDGSYSLVNTMDEFIQFFLTF